VAIIHRYDAFTILYDFRSACPVSRRGYSSFALENDKLEANQNFRSFRPVKIRTNQLIRDEAVAVDI
jgi:hypothetical protein